MTGWGNVTEKTLLLIKPDGVKRKLVGVILQRFEDAGLSIVALRVVQPTREIIDAHLPKNWEWLHHLGAKTMETYKKAGIDPASLHRCTDTYSVGNDIRETIFNYYMQGPMVAMVLEGEHAVEKVRAMVGHTLPWMAEKGTIRGDYSLGEAVENTPGCACVNIVHASDSAESAWWEIPAWFSKDEMVSYK